MDVHSQLESAERVLAEICGFVRVEVEAEST
jgi:hypothetical protein